MKKGIIFDLDGTMWDSSESVTAAYNIALEKGGYPLRLTLADVRAAMGKTMVEIAHMYFDALDPDNAVNIMEKCIEEENEYLKTSGGVLYSGLEEVLKELRARGYFVACVSNCQAGYIEAFYEASGLGKYFDDKECWGGTGLDKAGNIRLTADRNGLVSVIYVGDTDGDRISSEKAGVKFVHAAYGYGSVPEGTPKINSLRELPDLADVMTEQNVGTVRNFDAKI